MAMIVTYTAQERRRGLLAGACDPAPAARAASSCGPADLNHPAALTPENIFECLTKSFEVRLRLM